MSRPLAGSVPSPNIWHHTATYELENRAFDPERRIETAMRGIADWSGRTLLDLGCGTGFHLPRWAEEAAEVIGVEPHPDLVALARRRTRRLARVSVHAGTAQAIPLADASVDVVHVRWAYFFGPGCEPGLAELERVVRRGGTAFVVDNDGSRSTFGGWFLRGYPSVDPDAVAGFWTGHGWRRTPLDLRLAFECRADLESVVRIEFPPAVAEEICATHQGVEVDYAVDLWSRDY